MVKSLVKRKADEYEWKDFTLDREDGVFSATHTTPPLPLDSLRTSAEKGVFDGSRSIAMNTGLSR